MDKTLFEDLASSLQEAAVIAQGKADPSRRVVVKAPDLQTDPAQAARPMPEGQDG